MKKQFYILGILLIVMLVGADLVAQCPMCRMSLESNLEAGGTAGKKMNAGILYMLAVPYLLVFSIGYLWYRRNKRPGDFVRDRQETIPMT